MPTDLAMTFARRFLIFASSLAALSCSAGGGGGGEPSPEPTPGGGSEPPTADQAPTGQQGIFPGVGGDNLFDENELQAPSDCDSSLEVTYRDFSEQHPDFEMEFSGDVVRRKLVLDQLGVDKKPVFRDAFGCPPRQGTPLDCENWTPERPVITSADTFDQWYRTVDGVNLAFERTIELGETQNGSGVYVFSSNDFFPLEPTEGFGVSPANSGKNFLFTTEIHLNFSYTQGQVFSFRGDDDLWIFVNGRLAMDLGSMHGQEQGQIDFDAQAADLGIIPGQVYSMDIFHAERHTTGSNFGFETNIACFTPATVF